MERVKSGRETGNTIGGGGSWARIFWFRDGVAAISYSKLQHTGESTQSDTTASTGTRQDTSRIYCTRWLAEHRSLCCRWRERERSTFQLQKGSRLDRNCSSGLTF